MQHTMDPTIIHTGCINGSIIHPPPYCMHAAHNQADQSTTLIEAGSHVGVDGVVACQHNSLSTPATHLVEAGSRMGVDRTAACEHVSQARPMLGHDDLVL
jgi:hypothetical protein